MLAFILVQNKACHSIHHVQAMTDTRQEESLQNLPATVNPDSHAVDPHSCLPVNSTKVNQNALPIPGIRDCETTPVPHVFGLRPLPTDACKLHQGFVSAQSQAGNCSLAAAVLLQ